VKQSLLALSIILALAVAQLAACASDFDRAAMLESLGSNVIIPTYDTLSNETSALVEAAHAFCDAPSTSGLENLQGHWSAARVAWKQMDTIDFGPYTEQPWRLGPKIDFWPVREDTIEENLAGDEPLHFERVSALGASSRGFPAMEYLIFDPQGTSIALEPFEAESGDRRCDYVSALAEDLRANSQAMVRAWSHDGDDYLGSLVASGEPGTPFMSVRDASNEIVNRMLFLVETIMRLKLAEPLGLESGGDPRPELVESRYSNHSLEDILANLDGLENLYRGSYGDRHGTGVQHWVHRYDPDFDRQVLVSIAQARSAIEAIPEPLSTAVTYRRSLVQAAYDQMRELRNTIGVDMINLLAGSVTFNGTDGD
jgi:predicted lipoprotein